MSGDNFVGKEPCPECGSRDNLARYDDGHGYCFGCEYYEPPTKPDGEGGEGAPPPARSRQAKGLLQVTVPSEGLPSRGLTYATLKKFGCGVSTTHDGERVFVFPYRAGTSEEVAQKMRYPEKSRGMPWTGKPKGVNLFGAHLWGGGRKLVVTEGELDAMSVSQAQENKWPVVSLPNGAKAAARDLLNNLDYLEQFDEVILMFDQDEPGEEATQEAAECLVGCPFTVKVAQLPAKDANDLLMKGRPGDIISAIWSAAPFRPESIVSARDYRQAVIDDPIEARIGYPFDDLNVKTLGLREAEMVVLTGGTGSGKSAIAREIAYHLHTHGEQVGMLMLEEPIKRTLDGLVGIHLDKPIHQGRGDNVPDFMKHLNLPVPSVTKEEVAAGFDDLFKDQDIYLLDHFGSADVDGLVKKVRYMALALKCKWIILDHISIVVSGIQTNDERKAIDVAMTVLRTLVKATGVGLIVVCHLSRPSGDKGHEDGAEITLRHLRGSHSIVQLADVVIAIERAQQDPKRKRWGHHRILKCRINGETGPAGWHEYIPETGRLRAGVPDFGDSEDEFGEEDENHDF